MIENFNKQLIEIFKFRFVLQQLVRQQLILRYRRTVLGYLWTLINPLLMMTVTAIVFSTLFKLELKTYAIFLFAGMIPWNYFNSSVVQSAAAFINNESLIKKIYLPKSLFPLSISLGVLIDSILSFFALLIIVLMLGGHFSYSLIFIPVAFLLTFFFTLGIALVFSIVTVFFRDMQYIVTIAMQALFFLTPVLYNKSMLGGKVSLLVSMNPINPFIELFRGPLVSGVIPSLFTIGQSVLFSAISMLIGFSVFIYNEKKIVFRL